jgi:hypothetical protein
MLYTVSDLDIIRAMKSRRVRWAGNLACMGDARNAYEILNEKPEGRSPLERFKFGCEDNIKWNLKE